jgi:hypothetical protein
MRLYYLACILFAILLGMTNPFSVDMGSSIVPGWHTMIVPPMTILNILISVILVLVIVAYWSLTKKTNRAHWFNLVIHFTLTIPAIIIITHPFFIASIFKINFENIGRWMKYNNYSLYSALALFLIGQLFFFINYVRLIKRPKLYKR